MKLFITLLALFACNAMAGSADLSWIAPTLNTDGSAYDDPGGFIVYWGPSTGNYPTSQTLSDPSAVSYTVTDLTDGDWFFVVTAFDDGLNPDGSPGTVNESDPSSEAVKSILDVPVPPTDLFVGNTTAFTVAKQVDKFVLFAVGTVPAGTQCNPNQSVNGHFVVPIADVTITGTVEPVVVVAQCQ